MSDADADARIAFLEAENARLRRTLDDAGAPGALRHQVRNVLGVLRAMMRRMAETATSVESYAAHLEGRFDALLRVQAMVLSSADAAVDLHALVSNELLAHVVREGEKAHIAGPPVRMPARTAEVLGLALHELATNAVKFGALPLSDGTLAIDWEVGTDGHLTLTWAESGGSSLVTPPVVRGFGMEALEIMLPYQIKAETKLEFRPEGVSFKMRIPYAPATNKA